MKITISQKDLNDTLSLVNYAVPNKPYHPILNNVLLIADKDNQRIAIAAFDLSLGIRVECKCKIENDGMMGIGWGKVKGQRARDKIPFSFIPPSSLGGLLEEVSGRFTGDFFFFPYNLRTKILIFSL